MSLNNTGARKASYVKVDALTGTASVLKGVFSSLTDEQLIEKYNNSKKELRTPSVFSGTTLFIMEQVKLELKNRAIDIKY
jgi:hypothetical protein